MSTVPTTTHPAPTPSGGYSFDLPDGRIVLSPAPIVTRFPFVCISFPVRGNSDAVITALNRLREEQGRTFTWLARTTKTPYKRILAQLKNRTTPLTLEVALAVSIALGVELPSVIAEATAKREAVAS